MANQTKSAWEHAWEEPAPEEAPNPETLGGPGLLSGITQNSLLAATGSTQQEEMLIPAVEDEAGPPSQAVLSDLNASQNINNDKAGATNIGKGDPKASKKIKPKPAQLSAVAVGKSGNKARMLPPKKVPKKASPLAPAPGDHPVDNDKGDTNVITAWRLDTLQICLIDLLKSPTAGLAIHQIAETAPKAPKGLAKTLIEHFPEADCYEETQARNLGQAIFRKLPGTKSWLVAVVAQRYPGKPNNTNDTAELRLDWLKSAMEQTAEWIRLNSKFLGDIWIPEKIGAGLAGGCKTKNKALIQDIRQRFQSDNRWAWIKEPEFREKHENITNKAELDVVIDSEKDPGDDVDIDEFLLNEAINEAIDQDLAVIPEVPQLILKDKKKTQELENVKKKPLEAENQLVTIPDAQADLEPVGDQDRNQAFSTSTISLEEWMDKYGEVTEREKELRALRADKSLGKSSTSTKLNSKSTSKSDTAPSVTFKKVSIPRGGAKKDIAVKKPNGKLGPIVSTVVNPPSREDKKKEVATFKRQEIERMVDNFRFSLEAQMTADEKPDLGVGDLMKQARMAERSKMEQRVGINRWPTAYDDLPEAEHNPKITDDSESEDFVTYCQNKKEKHVIRVPQAPMPGAWGNQNTHRGQMGDIPNFDPYANLSFVANDELNLPTYKMISNKDILKELQDGSSTRFDMSVISKSPLTDLVWLLSRNEPLRIYILRLPMGNDKELNPLITRALSREIISIVFDMELYCGLGYSVKTEIRDICKTAETMDWFINAGLPMMRSAMVNEVTKQAAHNLKIAADACRFGKRYIHQDKIDKFWQSIVPDPSTEQLNTQSSYVMYAVISCLASNCSPKMMGRKIYMSKLKKDKEWKSSVGKWDIKVMEEDSASEFRQHPLIPTSALKTLCDSMASKVKKITKLDNIAGIPLQDHTKLIIELAVKKIINNLQFEALKDNDVSSADPTAASFDKIAGTQLINKMGLFGAFLLVATSLFKDMEDHDILISIKNSFAGNQFFKMQEAKDKARLSALQILIYVLRDEVKKEKFDNWICTSERNNMLRDCIGLAKKSMLDNGVITQTTFDRLPDSTFSIKDAAAGEEDKKAKEQKGKKDKKKKNRNRDSDDSSEEETHKKKEVQAYNGKNKFKTYGRTQPNWGSNWSWNNKSYGWGSYGKYNPYNNYNKRDRDDNSPADGKRQKNAKDNNVQDKNEKAKADNQEKDKPKNEKWMKTCAEEYGKLSKAEQKKLAEAKIKLGGKPDTLEVPQSICLKGLLGKCGNKNCKRTCKTFANFYENNK